jgi:hypothetical protein
VRDRLREKLEAKMERERVGKITMWYTCCSLWVYEIKGLVMNRMRDVSKKKVSNGGERVRDKEWKVNE